VITQTQVIAAPENIIGGCGSIVAEHSIRKESGFLVEDIVDSKPDSQRIIKQVAETQVKVIP
jgi:hypothetical protein